MTPAQADARIHELPFGLPLNANCVQMPVDLRHPLEFADEMHFYFDPAKISREDMRAAVMRACPVSTAIWVAAQQRVRERRVTA